MEAHVVALARAREQAAERIQRLRIAGLKAVARRQLNFFLDDGAARDRLARDGSVSGAKFRLQQEIRKAAAPRFPEAQLPPPNTAASAHDLPPDSLWVRFRHRLAQSHQVAQPPPTKALATKALRLIAAILARRH